MSPKDAAAGIDKVEDIPTTSALPLALKEVCNPSKELPALPRGNPQLIFHKRLTSRVTDGA
jgi:hypothetical protein